MKPLWELTVVAYPNGTDRLEVKVGGSSIEVVLQSKEDVARLISDLKNISKHLKFPPKTEV